MSSESVSWLETTGQFRGRIETPGPKQYPVLGVLRGAQAGSRVPLPHRRITLGRSFESDIVLNDERVSCLHVEICPRHPGGYFALVDLGSTNGTYVNGRPVHKARLMDGDKINLGSTILKFVVEDRVESESGALIESMMFRDDLTGLAVQRRFEDDLRVQLQSARSSGRALSVLMMDLDGLKRVNDRHGHSAGAFVISQAGRLIGNICDALGQACRCGGDEFVAYLVDADKPRAFAVAECVRVAIRDHRFEWEGESLRVFISIGVASHPEGASDPQALIRAADEILSRAKTSGRDRVCS